MLDYTVTGVLQSIRDITYTGTSLRDWPDDRVLRVLNREIEKYLVPMMMAARTNHLATYTDIPLVSAQSAYWLPSKAAGMKARAVQLVDSNGNAIGRLDEAPLEDLINYGASLLSGGTVVQGQPARYAWRGNQFVLWPVPQPAPALSLRIYYLNRPSSLVLNSACVQITSKTQGSGNYTLGYTGTLPTGIADGAVCDLVQNVPGFDVLATGPLASHTGSTLVFSGTLPTQLQVGDWVCVTDTAPVVTGAIPELVIGCLIEKVALVMNAGKVAIDAFRASKELLKDSEKAAKEFLNKRNTGDTPVAGIGSINRFRGPSRGVW